MSDKQTDELPGECCAKCRFSDDICAGSSPDVDQGPEYVCRRFPPTVSRWNGRIDSPSSAHFWREYVGFPDVDADQWCGEFQPRRDAKPPENPVLDWPIRDMDVSVRCRHAMKRESRLDKQIVFVRDLVGMTVDELSGIKNFGSGSLREVREWLAKHGLYLKGD